MVWVKWPVLNKDSFIPVFSLSLFYLFNDFRETRHIFSLSILGYPLSGLVEGSLFFYLTVFLHQHRFYVIEKQGVRILIWIGRGSSFKILHQDWLEGLNKSMKFLPIGSQFPNR
jgi:hypothetical protein